MRIGALYDFTQDAKPLSMRIEIKPPIKVVSYRPMGIDVMVPPSHDIVGRNGQRSRLE